MGTGANKTSNFNFIDLSENNIDVNAEETIETKNVFDYNEVDLILDDQYEKGNINEDEVISLYDAFTILRKVISEGDFTIRELHIMDYNKDGKATLYDAFSFLRQVISG